MTQNLGARYLERKFSVEEREAYKDTLSDETEIEKQKTVKTQENPLSTADFRP